LDARPKPRRLASTMWLGSVIEMHEHKGESKECRKFPRVGYAKNEFLIAAMKSRFTSVTIRFLILVFLCAASIETADARWVRPAGRLVVARSANFGWNVGVNLAIDGRTIGNIVQGHRYHTWLPAGRHVLTVSRVPRTGWGAGPTSTTVKIKPGWTYLYTAMWDSNFVFLRPSGAWLTPGEEWQNGWPSRAFRRPPID